MSNYWSHRFSAVEDINNKRDKETVRVITTVNDSIKQYVPIVGKILE